MWWQYGLLGIGVGAFAAMVGVGGGILVVPALVLLFHFSQKEAQGTSLAMLIPPIGIFAAYEYWKQGFIRIPVAGFLAAGFVLGSLITSVYISRVPDVILKRVFGVLLLYLSYRMFTSK